MLKQQVGAAAVAADARAAEAAARAAEAAARAAEAAAQAHAAAEPARILAAQRHNADECELFDDVLGVQDYRFVIFDSITLPDLLRLRVDTLSRGWVDGYLERVGVYTIRSVDVAAGLQLGLLRRFCSIEGARIVLPAATYVLQRGPLFLPTAANGGMLQIAAHVALVGQEGVVLTGNRARMLVRCKGVRFESMHLPWGVDIATRGAC